MKILDSKGRLFGKVSILDLGAVLIILMVIVGIFFFPGTTRGSVAQIGNVISKPVELEAIAVGLKGRNLEEMLKVGDKTNLIIRNQPYGEVTIKSVDILSRKIVIPMSDGTGKVIEDPREEEAFSKNVLLVLEGQGRITDDGPVLGNIKVKIGNTVELEGRNYNFNASVINIQVKD